MKYTKGEWIHTEDGVIIASDGKQIASVFPRDREANAQLISASPALYEALHLLLKGGATNYTRGQAEQALAKVEKREIKT